MTAQSNLAEDRGPMLTAALSYARRGWPVFPLRPNGKLPLISKEQGGNGLHDATLDEVKIAEWWRRCPNANIGVATGAASGFFAFDCDPRHGGDQALDELEKKHGALPDTIQARTGGGGRHFLFRHEPDIRNSAGRAGAGLDARGDGGYIVVAPSSHESGTLYRWEREPGPAAPAVAPSWLRDLLTKEKPKASPASNDHARPITAYVEAAFARVLAELSAAREGLRNDGLNRAAFSLGQFVGAGVLPRVRCEAALRGVALSLGLPQDETEKTIASGLVAGIQEPREMPTSNGADGHWSRTAEAEAPSDHEGSASSPNSSGNSTWPDPDPSVLKEGRREAPPLPVRIFGPFWSEWLAATSEGANSPIEYPAASLLTSAAALIGNARWVSPWDGWKEPCILWCGVVGDPSSNKSPGIDPLLDMLRTIEGEMASGFDETHRRWQAEHEMAKAAMDSYRSRLREASKEGQRPPPLPDAAIDPPEPVRPRIIVNDSTPEKLGELLAANQRGLMFFRDELAGWFGAFDRYSGSGAERALWLEAFGGRKYTVDRVKSEKPIIIPHLSIGVLGGIQPEKLAELMKGPDDGLPSRFAWVWPETIPPRRPKMTADRNSALVALRRLASLKMATDDLDNPQPRIVLLTEEAAALFQEWRQEHRVQSMGLSGAIASAWGKAQGQLLRLALILQHLWWCTTSDEAPETISAVAIKGAAALVEDFFKPMAARVYGDAALPERDRLAAVVARWIIKTRPTSINARKLRREARLPGLKEADKVRLALEVLEDADWLRRVPERDGETVGRPRGDYVLNPKLAGVTYGE
jgi:Protein of unknown function (DUF3987)/Bifunctional DNA primase/polymerase, N-terminal